VTPLDRVIHARRRVNQWVTMEATSGILLLVAAAVALLWANSPWREAYAALSDFTIGPAALHLSLPLSAWAADGLLAVFFFVVGVELKHELVAGSLRHPREAAVPVLAAVGGMALPAVLFVAVILLAGDREALHGWAIPTATDIAFALAVLAIFGRGLPRALRTFLLTLAVVDDLLAIIVIAVFYTSAIDAVALAAAIGFVILFGLVVRSRRPRWWLLLPLALAAWGFMHASGVHATIAGVLLGFTVPARAVHGEQHVRTHDFDDAVRPFSSGIALPVFAFFSAGVSLVSGAGPAAVLGQPVVPAIVLGLVVGKPLGITAATWLLVRLTRATLDSALRWLDVVAVACVGGIGFTVALLIGELSFEPGSPDSEAGKAAILVGSLLSALLGGLLLAWRSRVHRASAIGADDVQVRTQEDPPHNG